MERLDDVRKTLKFYVRSNELKNKIIDKQNNYSVADHLFGSMILATAIDSEFKEAKSISKIYRMLFLSELSNVYPNYNFEDLKLGNQYASEAREAIDASTEDGRLVFNYKMLDFLLTRFIKEKEGIISNERLIREGSNIIALICNKKPYECKEVFKFYYVNFRLKNKARSGWDNKHWNIKSDRREKVSEHIIGTLALAIALNSEFEYDFDIDKEMKTLVTHETGETIIDDFTPFDGITPAQRKAIEDQAIVDALGNLKCKEEIISLISEFEEKKTLEGKCSRFCDKIEADLQAKIYQERGMHHSLDDQENNVVFKSSKVQQMIKDGAKNAFDIWYEWDKTIYDGDKQFPEFINALKMARDNNLFYLDKVVRERIDLTEEEYALLSQELSDVINELYKDDNIESIYVTNRQGLGEEKGIIYVTIILNPSAKSSANDYNYFKITSALTIAALSKLKNTGFTVAYNFDYVDRYSTIPMNSHETYNIEKLAESTIIFDKTGDLNRVQEETKNYTHQYDFNLVDYVPPLEETISRKLTRI